MKEYKFKYMDEAMLSEIQELWDNGHKDALIAYSYECANAGVTGYKRGETIGTALVLGAAGLVMAATYAVVKIKEKRALKRTYEADKECAEKKKDK